MFGSFIILRLLFNFQQRVCIKFYVKKGFKGERSLVMLLNQVQKNHAVFSRKSRQRLRFSWITTLLCIMIWCQMIKQLIKSIISPLRIVCENKIAKKKQFVERTKRIYPTADNLLLSTFFSSFKSKKHYRGRVLVNSCYKIRIQLWWQYWKSTCFENWIKHWQNCVEVDGEYFKGDYINFKQD